MKRTHGYLMKVLNKDTLEPTGLHRWNRHVFYCQGELEKELPAYLHYVDDNFEVKTTRTSLVTNFKEDLNNLTITTLNSIYYIKKFVAPKAYIPCQHEWEDTGYRSGKDRTSIFFKCSKCGQVKVE